jgi:hypothetical protein
MNKKIDFIGSSLLISKELCSEIIQPRRLMRALMREYEFGEVVDYIKVIYGLPYDEVLAMYFKIRYEKEVHNGRPKVLTEPMRAFIDQYRESTAKELYEHLRCYMGYTGSLKTVQNELTKVRDKHRIDF